LPILRQIVAEMPNHDGAWHEIGLIHTYRVDIDESIEALNRAVALKPNNINFLIDLAKAHTMYGDFDQAKPVFSRVLSIDPFNDEAQKQLDYLRQF